ncbi:gamma-glutamyl-phosphate reductase, partial [Staphylococcus aureus]
SEADLSMAAKICGEAKASYPAACNAVETILVHQDVAARFLPSLLRVFNEEGVEARCDRRALSAIGNDASGAKPATDDDFGREFSDLIV